MLALQAPFLPAAAPAGPGGQRGQIVSEAPGAAGPPQALRTLCWMGCAHRDPAEAKRLGGRAMGAILLRTFQLGPP